MKRKKNSKPTPSAPATPEPALPGLSGVVGIDVAKASAQVCFLSQAGAVPVTGNFKSDSAGRLKLLAWLERISQGNPLHLCLEETGSYGQALAAFLHEAGYYLSVVNAGLIKNYGASLNVRTKTDSVDAHLIARYTLERVPARWTPLAPQHQALRDLARRRQQVLSLLIQEKNHQEACLSLPMKEDIGRAIAHLRAQVKELELKMAQVVKSDPRLAHNAKLLKSIPGIGQLTAHLLLAELPPLDSFGSARQLCAYAGLSPRRHDSGTFQGRSRLCKQGRAGLRTLLFMPAVSILSTKSGVLREFARRLLDNGKKPLCVVGALMRKLMGLVFAILRSGKEFDPGYKRSTAPAG